MSAPIGGCTQYAIFGNVSNEARDVDDVGRTSLSLIGYIS